MNRYETLLLAVPGITGDESGLLERNFEKLLQESKGTVVSFEKWGKCRLAYPVRHNAYGVYFLVRFELDPASTFFDTVDTMFTIKYSDVIMRSSTVKIEGGKKYADFRPDTVEEMPTRDVNDFLRENKMQGLIASDDDMDDEDERARA